MKMSKLKERLNRSRPMTTVTLRMPEDVVDDLKQIAPRLGFSGYQPLIRAYVGQGLRADLERLEGVPDVAQLIENLKQLGVEEGILSQALSEAKIQAA